MDRSTSASHRPPADPNSIESKYLASTVGPALVRGLAEIAERRPNDPIEYLANYLYKEAENRRIRREREDEVKQIEIERVEAEEKRRRQIELKNEIRTLRENEEHQRQLLEEEERRVREEEERQREAEELAKKHREMNAAAAQPTLAAVREEEESPLEPGEVELHRFAAREGVDLSDLIRQNPQAIALRNSQGKTPRELAVDAGLDENVEQIDAFCNELIEQENRDVIQNLLLAGYTTLINQLENSEGNKTFRDQMLQFARAVSDFQQVIKQGDLTSVETMLAERANLAFYRDQKGATALHDALECGHVDIAWHFIENFPSLMTIKDFFDRTCLEIFNSIDEEQISDDQHDLYEKVRAALTTISPTQQQEETNE